MRVLFVDDEPNILDSIRRQLRKSFDVVTANSGIEALALLKDTGPVAVVVSDMRMPGMNGAELLTKIRDQYPDTVRMILSGQADLESTIAAINDGHIFRFLTKPCQEDALRRAVSAGIEQYELVTTRKELLEKTLQGLVEMLTDILGITNPVARRRTGRVRQYSAAIASALKFTMPWDLRLATLLSQLGCITLPVRSARQAVCRHTTRQRRTTPLPPSPRSGRSTDRPHPATRAGCRDGCTSAASHGFHRPASRNRRVAGGKHGDSDSGRGHCT